MIKKLNLLPYIFMIASSVGYYSNIGREDSLFYFWITIFVVSLIILTINNNDLFKKHKSNIVYYDMLFVLGVILIPRINLPYGASRLIMAILGAIYALLVSRKKNFLKK
ncbi:hypothetical protein [uncultured Anaerococcus sp.]|uniref:hypothetical protein n=1 Tax=uncultured Anaerococcus sp. TaxID=293428 RepID=UPI0026208334|nr:hypothetical protein [uncultured Anaerococcus sp.]